MTAHEITDAFIESACIPMDGSLHVSGSLDRATTILAENPSVATANIFTAATLGNDAAVRQFLQVDASSATAKGGPFVWDALTHLCFSRFLRLDPDRSKGLMASAKMLLDAGADPNTGFFSTEHEPHPTWESVLYGAAGVAHHSGLTRLLLDRGADPNDGETEYHAPEGFDNTQMEIIVESGKLLPSGLTTMLHRKLDWTNYAGVVWLLDHGADPNAVSMWGFRALDHSLARNNALRFMETLLDYGANPLLESDDGLNAYMRAAIAGRADALDLFENRGFRSKLEGEAELLAACARGNAARAKAIAAEHPDIIATIGTQRPDTLAEFAGAGNAEGVRILLDLGFDIESRSAHAGPRGNTALHLAVWRERLSTVELLLSRNAPLETRNPDGDTALSLAALALTENSEWSPHESTAIVAALLQAGADVSAVRRFPTGSDEADDLLRRFGRAG
jgi:ankyrin repeat protein